MDIFSLLLYFHNGHMSIITELLSIKKGGAILLNDIGDISPALQVKLLRGAAGAAGEGSPLGATSQVGAMW